MVALARSEEAAWSKLQPTRSICRGKHGVVGAINPLWPGATLSMAGRAAALALWTTRLGHLLSAGGLIALVLHTWLTILEKPQWVRRPLGLLAFGEAAFWLLITT
jgi:hypothetical protein